MSHFTEWLFRVVIFLNTAKLKKLFASHVAFGPSERNSTSVKNDAAKKCNILQHSKIRNIPPPLLFVLTKIQHYVLRVHIFSVICQA